jgi:hypothetical protein
MVDTEYQSPSINRSTKPKRFEAKWFLEKDFAEVVKRAWEVAAVADPEGGVLGKLGLMHNSLHAWDSAILQKPKNRLKKVQQELENAVNGPMTDENEVIAKEKATLIEIILEQEEVHWQQRSRVNWLQQGDRNTSFFHSFASARRKKNSIKKLRGEDGNWVEGTDQLKPLVFQYFANLFSSEVAQVDPTMMEKINPKVTDLMNTNLLAPFSAEEVRKAMLSIGDYKAPGPDGLHAIFYKKFWNIYGDEITQEILQHSIQELFQMGGTIPRLF